MLRSRSCLQQTLSSSLRRCCGLRHNIWIPGLGPISSRDDKANLVIWCVFSGFFNKVDSWGYVGFLYCLAEIFVGFFGGFCWDFLEISL